MSDARRIITGHQEETECCMNLQEYLASELVRLFESGLVALTKKSEVVFMSQAITSNCLLTREIGKWSQSSILLHEMAALRISYAFCSTWESFFLCAGQSEVGNRERERKRKMRKAQKGQSEQSTARAASLFTETH